MLASSNIRIQTCSLFKKKKKKKLQNLVPWGAWRIRDKPSQPPYLSWSHCPRNTSDRRRHVWKCTSRSELTWVKSSYICTFTHLNTSVSSSKFMPFHASIYYPQSIYTLMQLSSTVLSILYFKIFIFWSWTPLKWPVSVVSLLFWTRVAKKRHHWGEVLFNNQ